MSVVPLSLGFLDNDNIPKIKMILFWPEEQDLRLECPRFKKSIFNTWLVLDNPPHNLFLGRRNKFGGRLNLSIGQIPILLQELRKKKEERDVVQLCSNALAEERRRAGEDFKGLNWLKPQIALLGTPVSPPAFWLFNDCPWRDAQQMPFGAAIPFSDRAAYSFEKILEIIQDICQDKRREVSTDMWERIGCYTL